MAAQLVRANAKVLYRANGVVDLGDAAAPIRADGQHRDAAEPTARANWRVVWPSQGHRSSDTDLQLVFRDGAGFRKPWAFEAREPSGFAAGGICHVSSPWASGENTMQPTPSSEQRGQQSRLRSSRLENAVTRLDEFTHGRQPRPPPHILRPLLSAVPVAGW